MCIYACLFIYIHVGQDSYFELDDPVNSRRFPEIFGDFCKSGTIFMHVFVEICFLRFAPVDFRRKPEPVPRTQVLSQYDMHTP